MQLQILRISLPHDRYSYSRVHTDRFSLLLLSLTCFSRKGRPDERFSVFYILLRKNITLIPSRKSITGILGINETSKSLEHVVYAEIT